jgi:phage protein D
MPILAGKLGIRLVLMLGQSAPRPASADVMTALQHVEVVNNIDGEDGFQIVFALSKSSAGEFSLVRSGVVDPDTRAVIGALIGARLHPLMDGVIYHQQLAPAQDPGTFTLTVMGRSIQVMLDLEEKNQPHPNQSDGTIVRDILSRYQSQGIADLSGITLTNDTPSDKVRIPNQQVTDLAYIRRLAKQNGFIFYIEPKTLGTTAAYWGPADRSSNSSLPALCVNLGWATNVTDLYFNQDPLAPLRVEGDTIDPTTKKSQKIPPPPYSMGISTARRITPRRTVRLRWAARLGPAGARNAAAALAAKAPHPVTAEGALDTMRYGDVLRAHRIVSVRGAGRSYDGDYLVRRVTHEIEVGKYTQRFTLSRQGLEAAK